MIAAETAAVVFLCMYLPSVLPVAAAFTGVWLLNLLAITLIAARRGSPEINCALALFVTALPVAGAVIYFFAAVGKRHCGHLNIKNPVPESDMERAALQGCGVCGAGYENAVYFKSGGDYLAALIREIETAKKRVCLEYFIISRGKIFAELFSALQQAKRNGAEIFIVMDGVGSAFRCGRKELKRLKTVAEVKIFHRLTPMPYSRLNFRDHRKIATVDGRAAFTGGVNIADEYANIQSPHGYWKDTGVAVYGAAAQIFEGLFLSVFRKKYYMDYPKGGGEMRCLPYCDCPPHNSGFCEDLYACAIANAKRCIYITTPYFCAGEKLSSALAFAAARGVDVRIIIPHLPDKKYAFELSKASAERLTKRGVKFYEYTPGFMHSKSMVCDDRLFIGSYNFDYRSMRLNYECGVALDGKVADDAERDFWECLRLSSPLCDKPSCFRRAYRFFLKLVAPLM
ncbi:MAG: phosphatidylserine/phosphatidylglycerophosphate/cardiolipin synthase family protein [Clostridia bacterium]|nr:phosphatidylserine/phosphatidylglycerophosphate/cardiolipin synthase family protein [Clostridia bacterium]